MSDKSTVYANALLLLIFNAVDFARVADNAAAAPLVNLHLSFHTAAVGVGGNQTTNEATYTGYVRVAVARTAAGWTVTGNQVTNAADITLGTCTALSDLLTHFAIGTEAAGAGDVLYQGALSGSYFVDFGKTPEFAAGELLVTEG